MLAIKTKIEPIIRIRNIIDFKTRKVYTEEQFNALRMEIPEERKIKERCYRPPTKFNVDRIHIKNLKEIDYKDWMIQVYNKPGQPYKKDLLVSDTNDQLYEMYGCFPISISDDTITIIFDWVKEI